MKVRHLAGERLLHAGPHAGIAGLVPTSSSLVGVPAEVGGAEMVPQTGDRRPPSGSRLSPRTQPARGTPKPGGLLRANVAPPLAPHGADSARARATRSRLVRSNRTADRPRQPGRR